MKCICTKNCQFNLATYAGEIVELTEEQLKQPFFKGHFEPLDKKEAARRAKPEKKDPEIDGLKARLDGMNVRYPARATKQQLEQLLIDTLDPEQIHK